MGGLAYTVGQVAVAMGGDGGWGGAGGGGGCGHDKEGERGNGFSNDDACELPGGGGGGSGGCSSFMCSCW